MPTDTRIVIKPQHPGDIPGNPRVIHETAHRWSHWRIQFIERVMICTREYATGISAGVVDR